MDDLTIARDGDDIVLRWSYTPGNYLFSVHSDTIANGSFTNLVGTTTGTTYVVPGIIGNTNQLFFTVKVGTP